MSTVGGIDNKHGHNKNKKFRAFSFFILLEINPEKTPWEVW
jgi:hypothetical protein